MDLSQPKISSLKRFGLLSAAAKAEIPTSTICLLTHDVFLRIGSFTSSSGSPVAPIVIESAYELSILCRLAFFSIHRYLSVTMRVRCLCANLAASFSVGLVPDHDPVFTTSTASRSRAPSTGRGCSHMERLPGKVKRRQTVKTSTEEISRQTAMVVQGGETTWFTSIGESNFQRSNLKSGFKCEDPYCYRLYYRQRNF